MNHLSLFADITQKIIVQQLQPLLIISADPKMGLLHVDILHPLMKPEVIQLLKEVMNQIENHEGDIIMPH